ncbi:MAG: hypothetical protein ACRC20_04850 [Segniliparus sp.]|uniref:hypothetical protein n=1 Tax=Segniliparus sp. TaxID=2804064 RepID=UPI003F37D5E1
MGLSVPSDEEVVFETSGSTGPARRWARTSRQLVCEVDLIADRMIGEIDMVVSYAPPRHVFGSLFGEWLPRTRGVPVAQAWANPYEFPEVPPGARVLVVCVPMAWDLLRRNWRSLARARSVVALHSSAAAPAAAYEAIASAGPKLTAHEILGSTETGGIAHRQLRPGGEDDVWTVLPDVVLLRDADVRPGGGQALLIRSPRLARSFGEQTPPESWATGDLVEFVGTDGFRLIGRSSSLIKVNGVKVYLSEIERRLAQSVRGADFVAVPTLRDRTAGEGYIVFWVRRDLNLGTADVRRALSGLPSPAHVVELARIPLTPQGKPDRGALARASRTDSARMGGRYLYEVDGMSSEESVA